VKEDLLICKLWLCFIIFCVLYLWLQKLIVSCFRLAFAISRFATIWDLPYVTNTKPKRVGLFVW